MKKKLAAIGLTLGLMIGAGTVAAPAASADTMLNCYNHTIPGYWVNMGYYKWWNPARYGSMQYHDFNWWEEVWQGKRDGWYFYQNQFCA